MEQIPITAPQMGVIQDFIVLKWLTLDGSSVFEGESLIVIETEKAEVMVESPATGQLRILIQASDTPVQIIEQLGYVIIR